MSTADSNASRTKAHLNGSLEDRTEFITACLREPINSDTDSQHLVRLLIQYAP